MRGRSLKNNRWYFNYKYSFPGMEKTKEQDKKHRKKWGKIALKSAGVLSYGEGLLINSGSWRTSFMRSVLMALGLYIYIYIQIYIYIYINICIFLFIYLFIYLCTCLFIHLLKNVYRYIYIYMYIILRKYLSDRCLFTYTSNIYIHGNKIYNIQYINVCI